MKHRLYIVEGLPSSGKSTMSAYLSGILQQYEKVTFVDEGSGNHPADYEFHALAPAGFLSENEKIVSLSQYSGELLEKLLPYKIYDGLPWELECPVMLDKWRAFVRSAELETTYVFNCVLLQNPMCETMMRFGFSAETSKEYIEAIAEIIRPMNPVVVYLKNEDIAASVEAAALRRPGWLDAVIDYHVHGAYGMSIGAHGLEGYIRCLQSRQERELQILSGLPVCSIILENPQRDWKQAEQLLESGILKNRMEIVSNEP